MRVAGIQVDTAWEDVPTNLERLSPWVASAAHAGARLVVLTEMFSTGFSMHTDRTAEPPDGPSVTWLAAQAEEHAIWIAGSVPELPDDGERPFNTLVLVAPDGAQHRYRKIHPFTYSGEHEHFRAGDARLTVDVEGCRTTFAVCYDLRFADQFWADAATTDLYVVPANWPAARRAHWTTLLQARAIENQAWVLGVNRVGKGGKLDYAGDSLLVDPLGEVRASAARGESMVLGDVDPGFATEVRERFPFLQDR